MLERLDRFWAGVAAAALLACFIGVFAFLAVQPDNGPPLLIVDGPPHPAWSGDIYIGGAVANPGLYPFRPEDTLGDLIAAAGGKTSSAGQNSLSLTVPLDSQGGQPQRIDLNSADAWLLDALPGIGPSTAASIVDYRNKNGPFRMVRDLLRIPGIGEGTLQRINDYVTVGE